MDFSFVVNLSPILLVIGYWNIFKKFKVNKWNALLPGYNIYVMSKCVDRREDGTIYCYVYILYIVLNTIMNVFKHIENVNNFSMESLQMLALIISIVAAVYEYRIYKALIAIFGRRKRWIILWVLFPGITSCIWGLGKSFVPSITFDDDPEAENSGHSLAADGTGEENGGSGSAISKGFSINIKSRVASDGLRKKTLLKDIRLSIEPGNMVLLLGGSGAGKTTFLNAVTGYEKADARILLDGEDVYDRFDELKYRIGFVPQQDLIRYSDTVYHTVADAARLRLPSDVTGAQLKKRVEEVLDIFGLLPVKKNIVSKQSGGQKKRISIATEFVSDPAVFILDEPDSGLDGIMARELMTRLHEISRQGRIVIVITHTPDRVIDLFDRVIVLAKDENHTGRLVYYGPVDEAKNFFGCSTMEDVIKKINRTEEGGEGMADELLARFTEVQNGKA